MVKKNSIKLFGDDKIRAIWDEDQEKWYFSIVDVVAVLTDSADANAYWRKLKQRLKQEGNETVTDCHGLKMLAADGKMRMTDVADTEQLLRIIQSIPSHKAEPFKQWLAKVGAERLDQFVDVVAVLTDSADPKRYLKKMKARNSELQNNWGTICTLVQMPGADGKMREGM